MTDIARTGAVVKTEVLAKLARQGLSVWASAGAGIAPDLWVPGENGVLFSASKAATNMFRDSVNMWSVRLSPKTGQASGRSPPAYHPERHMTAHPAMTQSGDLLFASAEMRTGIWMLPLQANEGKVTGRDEAADAGDRFPRPAVRWHWTEARRSTTPRSRETWTSG